MIAVDTNILVYAHREGVDWHAPAYAVLKALSEGDDSWAIPWPCVHEFLAIVTHPKIFAPPTPLQAAVEQVEAWLESPALILLSEPKGCWSTLRDALQSSRTSGPRIHDARIAALCIHHGVTELWSADRDFNRFPHVRVSNPLIN